MYRWYQISRNLQKTSSADEPYVVFSVTLEHSGAKPQYAIEASFKFIDDAQAFIDRNI